MSQERVFGIRIVNLDYYTAAPLVDMDDCYSHFFGRSVMEVPVIRVYGSTLSGQKTCLHLHKAFPYFYVPYDNDLPQGFEEAIAYVRRLALALEKAMKMASAIGAKRQHVHCCDLVRARKFYGFYPSEDTFIKIVLYHPQEVGQMSALLLSGAILNRTFQPYEAHIPYLLQLKIDYNLAGMGLIQLSSVRFRPPVPDTSNNRELVLEKVLKHNSTSDRISPSDSDVQDFWLSSNIQAWSQLSQDRTVPSRCSTCELEADASVEGIVNKSFLSYTPLERIEPGRMMVQSLVSIWEGRNHEEFSSCDRKPHKHFVAEAIHKEVLKSLWNSGNSQSRDEDLAANLIESSQPANQHRSSSSAGREVSQEFMNLKPDDVHHDEIVPECSPSSSWKAVDEDTLELLKWMVSSQDNNYDGDAIQIDEQDHGEADLCKLFEGDGVESALKKTFRKFEILSQKECQDIVDCSQEDEIKEHGTGAEAEAGSEAEEDFFAQIPQYDGACDEELSPTSANRINKHKDPASKPRSTSKIWGLLPVTVQESPPKTKNQDILRPPASVQKQVQGSNPEASPPKPKNQDVLRPPASAPRQIQGSNPEASVRDLMRIKRGKSSRNQESGSEIPMKLQTPRRSLVNQYGSLPLRSGLGREASLVDDENTEPSECRQQRDERVCSQADDRIERVEDDPKEKSVSRLEVSGEMPMVFHQRPPSNNDVLASFKSYGLSDVEYPRVSYRDTEELETTTGAIFGKGSLSTSFDIDEPAVHLLTPALAPPSSSSVRQWLETEKRTSNSSRSEPVPEPDRTSPGRPASPKYNEMNVLSDELHQSATTSAEDDTDAPAAKRCSRDFSQISAPTLAPHSFTPASQAGFRDPAAAGAGQEVTVMSIEALAQTRGSLRPDPRYDSITCIAIAIEDDTQFSIESLVLVHDKELEPGKRISDGLSSRTYAKYFASEADLLQFFIEIVRVYDPDIIVGWEIQRLSLGFLAERAANLGIGLLASISRTPPRSGGGGGGLVSAFLPDEAGVADANKTVIRDEWGRTHGSGIYVGGRTVLNLWRIMRGEVKLGNYSIEFVAEEVLKRKIPRISWRDLSRWFGSGSGKHRFRALEYSINRTRLNLQLMNQLDLVNRTAELARVFGIDFYSVFSRGSQYRVESMMLRLAHSQNFLVVSPSKEQVAAQPAMECLPLVLEPESKLYTSPVIVLDFQSLYPSMIIAYNLCFSTCLGKLLSLNPKVLGVAKMWIPPDLLRNLVDKITVTPNGIMFVPPEVAPGVLPRLLQEILSTRVMVKNEMKKLDSSQRVLHRVLNARQFALKLIANVTYGYAAAGFSGRMPCAELADSIVQLGRHTLERAIDMVNANSAWGARVVYGDTDSMFVLLEGRTRSDAFKVGQEIAAAVTAINPDPVALKMEKVYHPCVLLTKKRYVGYSYESPTQQTPTFDAKGIETVRRDSCAAVAKTMAKSLRLLFETYDLSKVKQYLQRQWQKICSGRISIQDFIFSKEVRLGTYSSRASVLPPAAIVATKAMAADPRAEPCYGERIQYVVIHGKPGARLVDMVVDPYALLDDSKGLRLHDTYYITKQILPALQRVFGLLGVDLRSWFQDMSRVYQLPAAKRPRQNYQDHGDDGGGGDLVARRGRIDHYYASQHCAVCGVLMTQGRRQLACEKCSSDRRLVALVLGGRASRSERQLRHIKDICMHCGGGEYSSDQVLCVSLDCPVFFERVKVKKEFENNAALLPQEVFNFKY